MANTPTGGRAVGDADRHSSEPGSDPSALTRRTDCGKRPAVSRPWPGLFDSSSKSSGRRPRESMGLLVSEHRAHRIPGRHTHWRLARRRHLLLRGGTMAALLAVVGAGAAGGPLRRSVGSPSSRSRPAVLVVRVAHGRVAEPREAVVARPAPPQHIKPRLLSHWVLA